MPKRQNIIFFLCLINNLYLHKQFSGGETSKEITISLSYLCLNISDKLQAQTQESFATIKTLYSLIFLQSLK